MVCAGFVTNLELSSTASSELRRHLCKRNGSFKDEIFIFNRWETEKLKKKKNEAHITSSTCPEMEKFKFCAEKSYTFNHHVYLDGCCIIE